MNSKIKTITAFLLMTCAVFAQTPAKKGEVSSKTKKANDEKAKTAAIISKPVKDPKTMKTASGLEYTITSKGNGKKPASGDKVKVHYTGTLLDGTKFDSSVDRGQPFSFKLGQGQVIKGWDEGIALLNIGDKATFKIPAELGYGAQENGKIPANSTLLFDVELLDVIAPPVAWDATGKKVEKTASGLEYVIISKGKGTRKPAKGDMVKTHFSAYFKDGKLFESSQERGEPVQFQIGKGQIPIAGWEEGLMLLNAGDKAKLYIPYNLAFGEQARGPIPAKSDFVFDVELVDVTETVKPEPFKTEGKETQTTASGLKYVEIEKGTGLQPQPGDKVKVHYTGYFENGEIFDSSVQRGQPFEFAIGQGQVIKGWDEGVALMHEGGKYHFVIPYELAYGENGYGPIPAKSTLVFDVQLIQVIKN